MTFAPIPSHVYVQCHPFLHIPWEWKKEIFPEKLSVRKEDKTRHSTDWSGNDEGGMIAAFGFA